MAARNGARAEALPGSILLVVHDFVARSADELSLAKGDRIELIERDDDFGDGWFLGRHMTHGHTGLFPEVYTTPAPRGTLTGTPHERRIASDAPRKSADHDAAPTSPTHHTRHSSASSVAAARPGSASQASPLAQTALRGALPSPTSPPGSGPRTNTFNADSPVMNETLSVIDEHITDMHSPRASYATGSHKRDTATESIYSQPLNRLSYIPGHETDEDEQMAYTEDDVMAWSPERVAEHLFDQGVDRGHCDVFKEQEISGEVLLAMDQSSLFIKEFELGPVGRRLRTWHKIKALQDEVRQASKPSVAKSTSEYSGAGAGDDDAVGVNDVPRNRSSTVGTILPRGLEPTIRPVVDGRSHTLHPLVGAPAARAPSTAMSPLQSITSMPRPEHSFRPSAQSIRAMQHARRQSSIDSTASTGGASTRASHKKHPSMDQHWQPGQPMSHAGDGTAGAVAGGVGGLSPTDATAGGHRRRPSSIVMPLSPDEMDRGYFSSTEVENRTSTGGRKANMLTKKRVSTLGSAPRPNSSVFSSHRQNMVGRDKEPSGAVHSSNDSSGGGSPRKLQHMLNSVSSVQSRFGSMRSATSPQLPSSKPTTDLQNPMSPVVTKLEYNGSSASVNAVVATPGAETSPSGGSKDATPSPAGSGFGFFGSQRQRLTGITGLTGLRAISDKVTSKEKHPTDTPASDKTSTPPTVNEKGEQIASPTRTGSTTPSTETRSFDLHKSMDGQSRESTGSGSKLVPPPVPAQHRRMRPKAKKATSAYTRGLEKKTPAEQIEGCDYSGWMKKKSGSLMTTWKTRLFILRGRRLSYYYSADDTEEKGLIDISFHRVLPAHHETLTGLHAAMTGAAAASGSTAATTSPPASSTSPAIDTAAEKDLRENPAKPGGGEDSGLFIFKLVPPKPGRSRGVNFTKPMVHYFAVNSRQEGRLWMAALMKATIDRDDQGGVTTTYNQQTISLAKARARRERPPALMEQDAASRAELDGGSDAGSGQGLGIGGLSEKASPPAPASSVADTDNGADAASSIAPSHATRGEPLPESAGLNDTEKAPGASTLGASS